MKKIGRIYGEAKINVREMIGNRENTTEPPAIKRQTKNIEDVRTYLKEIYTRMQKQSKTNLLSIEESELVGNAFDEYGVKLREDGDFGGLGDVFVQLASFHQSIEALRLQMDTALQTKVAAPFHDFVSNEVRDARNEKLKYDKARVTYDALYNKAKQLKKKGSIDKIVEAEREVEDYKQVFEEIALDTVKVQSDVCEMHAFQTLERLCEYISIYEDFFTQGLHLAKQISKDLPSYKNTIKELKEEFKMKKLQRGDAEEDLGPNNVFGVPLEDLVARENTTTGLPLLMEHAFHYIYNNSLKVEGIFRVSGSQKEVQGLKKLIGRGVIDFSGVLNDHNITGVLKLYLRELPAPLIPFNLYTPIITCVQEHGKDTAGCTKDMRALLDTVPPANKTAIRYLFGLCHKIAENSAQNLMTPRNLAVVLAPNILYSREVSIEAVADSNGAIEFIIQNYENLFPGTFADLMAAIPTPTPTEAPPPPALSSRSGGTLRGGVVPASPAAGTSSSSPSTSSASASYSSPSPLSHSAPVPRSGVTAGAGRLAMASASSPAAAAAAPAQSPSSKPPATATAAAAKDAGKPRPAAVRGSSMFQIGQVEPDEYASLRKTPSEEAITADESSSPTNHVSSSYSTPQHQPIVTPSYLPGQNPNSNSFAPPSSSASPSVQPRPPASARQSMALSPGPKQLPPRPIGKPPPGSPLSASTGLPPSPFSSLPPPPPPIYSSMPPQTTSSLPPPPSTLPPPVFHQTILGSGKNPGLQPPPSLSTPPLKSRPSSGPQTNDLIQF